MVPAVLSERLRQVMECKPADGAGLGRAEVPPGPDGRATPLRRAPEGEEAVVGIFPDQSSQEREVASTRMTTVPRAGQAAIDNDGTVLCLKAGDVDV